MTLIQLEVVEEVKDEMVNNQNNDQMVSSRAVVTIAVEGVAMYFEDQTPLLSVMNQMKTMLACH